MTQPDFDTLWDHQRPEQTETTFRALLPEAERGPDRSSHLQLLTQIARAQGLQRHFDAAHETLDVVETQLDDAPLLARLRYLLERGRVFNSSGAANSARPLFQQAWDLSRAAPEVAFYAVDAAHMLAIVARSPAESITWNEAALERAEKSAPEDRARGWCGSLHNNLGWTHHDQGDFEEALTSFQRALTWQQEHGSAREVRVARWAVGRALRSLDRLEEALSAQEALREEWRRSGEQDAGYVAEEIAECRYAAGRVEESRPFFAEAHARLAQDPWLVAQEPDRLRRLQQLSQPQ
ncbi:tetratricopeptide repeat protein [Actinopolymorpha pittospori]